MTHTMEQLFLSKSKDNKPEFNLPWSSRFCGAFSGCEGADISILSQVGILYVMKKKNGTDKYDVPVRRAFR